MRAHESTLERDLLFLLEFDLNVATYEEQPVVIEYQDADGLLAARIMDEDRLRLDFIPYIERTI
jgi:hypothetical protein